MTTDNNQDTSSAETVPPPKPVQAAGDYVLVPREPTEFMCDAGMVANPRGRTITDDDLRIMYRAMLAASPALPAQPKLVDLLVGQKQENEAWPDAPAITPMPSGDGALREALFDVEKHLVEYVWTVGAGNAVRSSALLARVRAALASHQSASQEPVAERFDYVSDAQARDLFGTEDDEPLPDGRVRVCAGEWVRIPGGYYFDASAGLLHPETASEACDGCAVTIATPKTPSQETRLREALEKIAQPLDCGCWPCTGQCRSADSLQIELEERQDIARAALQSSPDAPSQGGGL